MNLYVGLQQLQTDAIALKSVPLGSVPLSSYMTMGRKEISADEFLARVEAKGYQHGAPQAEDRTRDFKRYKTKTIKDQDGPLGLYEKRVI